MCVLLISLTLLAYLTAFIDSSKLHDDGLMQQIMSVFAFPPSESFKIRVIFESRYGICNDFFLSFVELNALITLPNANKPELM